MGDLPNYGLNSLLRPLALQADIENLFEAGGNTAKSFTPRTARSARGRAQGE